MLNQLTKLMFAGFMASNVALAKADNTPDWQTQTLSGDWGGARPSLYNEGINLEFLHKSDVISNASGGIKRGTRWLGHTEAKANIDLEKLWGWGGMTANIHFHSNLGSKLNSNYVGSFMGMDNIEVATNTAQFYNAWVQKTLFDERLSVLAGLYAMDSEFYGTETSGVFLHPSFGMSAEIGQTGKNGPPIFPVGSFGVRIKYFSSERTGYIQAALLDGVPGDPSNPHGAHIQFNQGDGTLAIVEAGYVPLTPKKHADNAFDKMAIGMWRYTSHFDDLTDVDVSGNPVQRVSQGLYVLAEHTLFTEAGNTDQGLSGFVRYGMASKDIQQSDWSASIGLRYRGPFENRDDDIAGIAMTTSHASHKYRKSQLILGNPADSSEAVVEITYRAQLRPWLAVQPMVQRIFNPNMDPLLEDAWLAGVRLEMVF